MGLSKAAGSVSIRANKYSLCSWTCGDVPSRSFQHAQHRHSAAEKLESATISGNMLVGAEARAEESCGVHRRLDSPLLSQGQWRKPLAA